MDRSDFYYRQIVTDAELNQAFDDVAAMAAQLVTDLDGAWGVLNGLEVTEQSVPDLTVQVADGVATDEAGARIPVTGGPATRDLSSYVPSTPGESVYVRMYVAHDTDLQDPRLDGNNDPVDYRQLDSFVFSEEAGTPAGSPTKPAIAANKVLLATVLLAEGQTTIEDTDISMALTTTGALIPDRQEGGYAIFHSRITPARRHIEFAQSAIAGGEEVINLGLGNHLQVNEGTIRMAPLLSNDGDAIFMEKGGIYKASTVRSNGLVTAGAGYWYSDNASDEYGAPLKAQPKKLSYDASHFQCQNVGGETPHTITPAGNTWTINTTGTRPNVSQGWRFQNSTGLNQYCPPLLCPLVGLPLNARLDAVKFHVYVNDLFAQLEFGAQAYYRQAGNNLVTPLGTLSTAGLAAGVHAVECDIAVAGHQINVGTRAYFAVFWIYNLSAIANLDSKIEVQACEVEYSIREASGVYYHPTL